MNVQDFLDLKKNAEKGDAESQFLVGECYASGGDVQQDIDESNKWFRKAAEQGHVKAQLKLGNYYYDCYFRLYYDLNRPSFMRTYTRRPHCDEEIRQYHDEAEYWYQKCADSGNDSAQLFLADLKYKAGNFEDSFKYFQLSANQGNAEAQQWVGSFYEKGKVVEKNYSEAVKWYRRSAEQGNDVGELKLGQCYYNGIGISKNRFQAMKWYHLASEHGNNPARQFLQNNACLFDYLLFFLLDIFFLIKKPLVCLGIIAFFFGKCFSVEQL